MMVFRLSEELLRRGHEVIPVGPRHGIGWLGNAFRTIGVNVETYWLRRPLDPGCVRRLTGLLRANRIDVVHSHDFTMAVYGTAASRLRGVPHVITMHGGVNVCAVLRRRVALRWAMRNSSRTVMVSNATARQFAAELGMSQSRFAVIPNGVPVKTGRTDRVRQEFDCGEDTTVILAVGNLEAHKGHRVLLEALNLLRHRELPVSWKLIIAGGRGGPEHQPLLQFLHEHEMAHHVHIATGRDDIPDLQALADIYAMPSLIEGLQMALLEAMVASRAIVASITAGIPEAIVDEREGLLVPPGNANALADALQRLLMDPSLRERLGAAAGARGREEFTVQVMADHYEALYQELAGYRQRDADASHTVGVN